MQEILQQENRNLTWAGKPAFGTWQQDAFKSASENRSLLGDSGSQPNFRVQNEEH